MVAEAEEDKWRTRYVRQSDERRVWLGQEQPGAPLCPQCISLERHGNSTVPISLFLLSISLLSNLWSGVCSAARSTKSRGVQIWDLGGQGVVGGGLLAAIKSYYANAGGCFLACDLTHPGGMRRVVGCLQDGLIEDLA